MADRSQRWPSRTSLTVAGGDPARLTHSGKLPVRVYGICHGMVSCAGQRRACWGRFAHVFLLPARAGRVSVVAFGLRGVRRTELELDPRAELREPRVSTTPVRAPRTAPVASPRRGAAPAPVAFTAHVTARAPRIENPAVPVPRRLHSRTPIPVLRAIAIALRLPRPGESR
jgi:hypothetical protein